MMKHVILSLCLLFIGSCAQSVPVFNNLPPAETLVRLYDPVSLPCSASGSPQPKVVNWLANDKPIDFSTSSYTLRPAGQLQIARSQKSDTGDYQCVARNSVGGVASSKRRLIVAYFEKLATPATQRVLKTLNTFFLAGPPVAVACEPKPKYIWRKENNLVAENERTSISSDGHLVISNLQLSDTGTYTLTIENTFLQNKGVDFASQKAVEIILSVTYANNPPGNRAKIIYSSKEQTVGELRTSSVTLECFITGIPLKQVRMTWKKLKEDGNSVSVPTSSKYAFQHNGRRLVINKPTYKDDNGVFYCLPGVGLPFNEHDRKEVKLNVFSTPSFRVVPSDGNGFTDNSTSLDCATLGSPSHVQRWYRNGVPVVVGNKNILLKNNTLVIKNLNWEDQGIFQCGADNYAGLKFAQAKLQVKNISAQIVNAFRDIYAGYGSTVMIPCVAVGAPKPDIYWTLNSTRIILPKTKYMLFTNGTMMITDMSSAENGYYECVANNRFNIARKRAKVWTVVKTRFVEKPSREFQVQKGDLIYLPCKVEVDPNIMYIREWRRNNINVSNSRYVVQPDGALRIEHVRSDDTDINFSCHIFSSGGNISFITTLVMIAKPLQPSKPRVDEIQAYALRLMWDVPDAGGSPIIEYHLFMKNYSMPNYFLLAKSKVPTYKANNLRAGSRYKFKVGATNKFGLGLLSDETEWFETKTLAPSAAPLSFSAASSGIDFIRLAWVLPPSETHNGEYRGFYIGYKLAGSTRDFIPVKVVGGTLTSYNMGNLPLHTRYKFRIAAYNDGGTGVWSSAITGETKQGKPSLPPTNVSVSVLNDTAVKVYFQSPPQKLWNGILIEIVARTWPPERPQDIVEHITPYDSSSLLHQTFILPKLKANTEYTLAVAVRTTGGPSPGSSAVQFKTSEGVPGSVRDLQVSGIYSDAFTVSWKPPLEPSGQLLGYVVNYRLYGIGSWRELREPPLASGGVVSGLQERTRYEVRVAAFTSKGQGAHMSASVTTIESPVLPGAPSNLKSYDAWGTVIALGWTPGDSGRAVILYYLIEYNNDTAYRKNPAAALWRPIRNLTKILENPANLTHLRPSTTYRFRMTAYNKVGKSPVSAVSDDIVTGEGIPSKAPTGVKASAPERETLLIEWTVSRNKHFFGLPLFSCDETTRAPQVECKGETVASPSAAVPPAKDSWNSGSIKYQFLVKPKGQDPKIKTPYKEHLDTQASSYVARGLQKFTEYNITMRLINDKGFGPWTKPIFARTSEDYPAAAPTAVTAKVLNDSSVRVNWGPVPPADRNGVVLGYKVYYMMKGIPDTELEKQFSGNETFTGVITDLAGFTDYEFRLLAYTRVGGKFKSNPVTVKTERGKPGKPRDVRFDPVTYSLVTVKWNTPARPNGDILFYEVKYKLDESNKWIVHQDTFGPYKREADIRSLKFNAYYLFEIRAKSANGWGEPAKERFLVTTDRYVPESPVILAIPLTSVRTHSVIIKWRPRFDGNSPIRAYVLQYNSDLTTWHTYRYGIPPMENIPAHLNELEVLKLEPGTSYQFRVKAINDKGSSPWSDISKRLTTHPNVPEGAPFNVRVTSKTPTSLTVAWEPPKRTILTGKFRGYKVKYQKVGGIEGFKTFNVDKSKLEYRISNLKTFTMYDVRVGAFNDEGKGVWTATYVWRTGEAGPLMPPTNVKVTFQGSSKIRVQWEPPDLNSVRGYILGFKIESTRYDSLKRRRRRSIRNKRALVATCTKVPAVQTHLAGPYATEVTLKNLRKYTKYAISVRVYNTFGDGPKSEQIVFNTPKDVPGPPYILSERVYTNLVDIDFAEPCEPNGQILGYKVEYRESGGPMLPAIEYSKDTFRIRISNLKSNTFYLLELSAKTSVGYGQKAAIDIITKQGTRPPGAPGAPTIYKNEPAVLTLKWEEGDNGNLPIKTFFLRYRKANGAWMEYQPITASELRYDESYVVYSILGLKNDETYYFQVKSETAKGVSPYSYSSAGIKTAMIVGGDKPLHQKIWFIFILVIIALLLLITIIVCCVCCKRHKSKYKPADERFTMSSFQRSMVQQPDSESGKRLINGSRNGSLAPSVVSKKSRNNSVAKSYDLSDIDADKSSDETEYDRRQRGAQPEASIANHYSHDPFHKNWRDSMDKKTKKAILAEYGRRPSQASVDTLGEKKRHDSEEILDRPRGRPGRLDLTERKKMARSEPFLDQAADTFHPERSQQSQRPTRPGKRPVDRDLARSEPDLNRPPGPPESQVSRQPSFLRATNRGSDNESLHQVFEREKSKHDMAKEYENRFSNFYPSAAPPPYEFHAAPPAYSPSEQDDALSDDAPSERNLLIPQKPHVPPKPRNRFSDFSDSSDGRQPPSSRYKPPDRKFYSPDRDYERNYTPRSGRSSDDPRFAPEPRYATPSNDFTPAQPSRFDDELDDMDGYEADMTLV